VGGQGVGGLPPATLSVVIVFVGGLALLMTVNVSRAFAESGRRAVSAVPAK
jgi:hypothetical protein